MSKTQIPEIEQPIGRRLSLVARDFLCLLNSKLTHLDLERHYYALVLIDKADGEMTQQDLATKLDVDKVSMVRIIDYLTEMNYVLRVPNDTDRRKYSLTLTAKAKGELENIKAAINATQIQAFNGLTDLQINEFYNTLSIIQQNIKRKCSRCE